METWTVVRFLHLIGIAFFVGGQLLLVAAVAPAMRRASDEAARRMITRRFGAGTVVALGVLVATGAAMASHYSLWSSNTLQIKLMVLGLACFLIVLHVLTPTSRAVSYALTAASLLVLWLGVKLTYG